MSRAPYACAVLTYIPDPVRQERLNVAVALLYQGDRVRLEMRALQNLDRIKAAFGATSQSYLESSIGDALQQLRNEIAPHLDTIEGRITDLSKLAPSLLRPVDDMLRWTIRTSGTAKSFDQAMQLTFDRMVKTTHTSWEEHIIRARDVLFEHHASTYRSAERFAGTITIHAVTTTQGFAVDEGPGWTRGTLSPGQGFHLSTDKSVTDSKRMN